MKTTIGAFNPDNNSVEVKFDHNGISHTRAVNACLTDKGKYDAKATAARVEDVARGVAVKIEAGVITNTLPNPDADSAPEASAG